VSHIAMIRPVKKSKVFKQMNCAFLCLKPKFAKFCTAANGRWLWSTSSLCSTNFTERVTRISGSVSQDTKAVSITKTSRLIRYLGKITEYYADSHPKYNKTGNVRITVILKGIRVTICAVERKWILQILSVCL